MIDLTFVDAKREAVYACLQWLSSSVPYYKRRFSTFQSSCQVSLVPWLSVPRTIMRRKRVLRTAMGRALPTLQNLSTLACLCVDLKMWID